jgi:iron complex outermembrane receptor protein
LDAATQLDWRTERQVRGGRITDTLLTDQREQFSSGGIYLSAAQSFGNLTLRAGARVSPACGVLRPKDAERKAVTYFPILPSAGVFYVTGPAMLFTTFQTGYDTPTLNEWSAPQTTETATQKLLPERSRTLEAGASITTPQHRIRLAVYNMTVFNRIGTFESAVLPGAVLYRNEGKSFHRGAEVSMELFASSPIRFQQQLSYGTYTFVGGALDGKQLPGVPKLHAGTQLSYVSPLFHIQLLHQFSTARYADSNNTVRVDGFSVWNARIAANLSFGGRPLLNMFVAGFNLGNSRYSHSIAVNANAARYYEPAATRNYRIGIALRY